MSVIRLEALAEAHNRNF